MTPRFLLLSAVALVLCGCSPTVYRGETLSQSSASSESSSHPPEFHQQYDKCLQTKIVEDPFDPIFICTASGCVPHGFGKAKVCVKWEKTYDPFSDE